MGSIKSALGTSVPNAPVPVGRSQSAEVRRSAITPRDMSVPRPPSAHERKHTTLHFPFASARFFFYAEGIEIRVHMQGAFSEIYAISSIEVFKLQLYDRIFILLEASTVLIGGFFELG